MMSLKNSKRKWASNIPFPQRHLTSIEIYQKAEINARPFSLRLLVKKANFHRYQHDGNEDTTKFFNISIPSPPREYLDEKLAKAQFNNTLTPCIQTYIYPHTRVSKKLS